MKMLRYLQYVFFALCIVGAGFLAACNDSTVSNPTPGSNAVSGVVTDEDGLTVPNATVLAVDASGKTVASTVSDTAGAFSLASLTGDLKGLSLHISREDIVFAPASLANAASSAGGLDGLLLHVLHSDTACSRVVVTVTDSAGHTALAHVLVQLRRGDRLISSGNTTDGGSITFPHVMNGEYNVRLSLDGYNVVEHGNIHVSGCDTIRLSLSMSHRANSSGSGDSCCNGTLRIVPRDSATNNVISGASVRITRANGTQTTGTTNGDGYTFTHVCAGTYAVRIAKDGYHVVEYSVTVSCNGTITSTRTLVANSTNGGGSGDTCCNSYLTVIVRDSTTGSIMTGATITVTKNGTTVRSGTSGANGNVFDGLCNGQYVVHISRDGYHTVEIVVTFECNSRREVTGRLLANSTSGECCHGVLTVNTRDSSSNSVISGATVRLSHSGTTLGTVTSNGDGNARFTGLCPGTYVINQSKDGYAGHESVIVLSCNDTETVTRHILANSTQNCCNSVMSFRVRDSALSGDGWLSGVHVTIAAGNSSIASGTTSSTGSYGADGICGHTTYTATFSKDGYHSVTLTYQIGDCRTITETVVLRHN